MMIRVFLIDDDSEERERVGAALAEGRDIHVVGRAPAGDQALAQAGHLGPQVIIAKEALNDFANVSLTAELNRRHPSAGVIVPISYPGAVAAMLAAFVAGARGVLAKGADPELIRQAVRAVARGGTFVDPSLAAHLVAFAIRRRIKGPFGLSYQEMRVLTLLPKGCSNREIGQQLGISEHTVKIHLRHAMGKLGVKDRAAAAALAVREGLVK